MPKSAEVLSAKEVEAKLRKIIADAKEKLLKDGKKIVKTGFSVGGCDGAGVDVVFTWAGDTIKKTTLLWRVRYTLNGKARATTFGSYYDLTLAQFRDKAREFLRQIKDGVDVVADRKQQQQANVANSRTFGDVATEWLLRKKSKLTERTYKQMLNRFNLHFAKFCPLPIQSIKQEQVKAFLSEYNDKTATREKLAVLGGGIFRYAVLSGYVNNNPFEYITELLPERAKVEHYPTLTNPAEIADLMRKLDGYKEISPILANLALFSIYTLARGQEARHLQWEQVDMGKKLWTVPESIMKTRKQHIVPLSTGAIQCLNEVKQLLPKSSLVFPSGRLDRPFSDNAVRIMLKTLGYDTGKQLCPHGFRAMGSTQLNELNYPRDWVDLSLAHKVGNDVSLAYNHSLLLEQRAKMLETWYLYLNDLRDGADIQETRQKYYYKGN